MKQFTVPMAMGYLSSRNFDGEALNWIAQGINIAGQGCLYLGCSLLHKAGLRDWKKNGMLDFFKKDVF